MGKTYRRDQQFRPKKNGRVFDKDQSWKKFKHREKPSIQPKVDYIESE